MVARPDECWQGRLSVGKAGWGGGRKGAGAGLQPVYCAALCPLVRDSSHGKTSAGQRDGVYQIHSSEVAGGGSEISRARRGSAGLSRHSSPAALHTGQHQRAAPASQIWGDNQHQNHLRLINVF